MSAPEPSRHLEAGDGSDLDRLAASLERVSAELEGTAEPDRGVLAGEGPEAAENRSVRGAQAALARAAARALRHDGEVRRAARDTREQTTRARVARPAAADVPVSDLERLAARSRAVAGSAVWAEIAVPTVEGAIVTAAAGRLPTTVVHALATGPRTDVLRTGHAVAIGNSGVDARWPGLRSAGAQAFLVLPLGIWGTLTLAAASPHAFDDAARAVARELAVHGAGLFTRDGAGAPARSAMRARQLVLGASALLARHHDLDPGDGLDALLERAAATGATLLDCARGVVEELGPSGDDGTPRAPDPATLRRALAYLDDHAAEDVDVADVAAAAGLGVRGLQMTFRRWRGTTPLGHLRELRLTRAHEELRASDPRETTVADVATRWHFTHPGRFSVTYREHYGCSPSETLRA